MNPPVLHRLTFTYVEAWKSTLTGEEDAHPHQQDGDEQEDDTYQYDFYHIVWF